jgi:hypothetical protein
VLQGVLVLVGRLALGIAVGAVLAAALWAAIMTGNGHSVTDALNGQIEDAIGKLEGLVALGTLCGAGIGLFSGLFALGRADSSSK